MNKPMVNILFPVNKSVTPNYKYYGLFLNRLSDYLGESNIKVTFLLFSKYLINQVDSNVEHDYQDIFRCLEIGYDLVFTIYNVFFFFFFFK